MSEQPAPLLAGVRFMKVGKVYHFDAHHIPDLKVGDQVVVETSRGWQLGTVAQLYPNTTASDGVKMIDRRATPRDLLLRQTWQAREEDVLAAGQKRASDLGLVGIKVILAEYSFDGSRLSILFSTESEDKFELKSLRQDMQRAFAPSTVELRQIGPRDVAKMMGGMGACGLEQRCCSQFLCEFSSISIKMAKEQGISLTPTEITGMCGRLRCCLIYEYEQYTQARALLPKRNKRVLTPQGEGRILDQIPLRDAVYVQLMDDTRREFKRTEIQLLDENGVAIPQPLLEGVDQVSLAVEREVEVEEVGLTPHPFIPPPPVERPDRPPQTPRPPRPEGRPERPQRGKDSPPRGQQDTPAQGSRPQPQTGKPPQNQARPRPVDPKPVQPARTADKAEEPPRQRGPSRPSPRPAGPDRRGGSGQSNQGNRSGQGPRRRSGDQGDEWTGGRNTNEKENKPDDPK